MQSFLPYIPEKASSEALDIILQDIKGLLDLGSSEFWTIVHSAPSLFTLIESYLQLAPRPFDEEFFHQTQSENDIWSSMHTLLHRLICLEEAGSPVLKQRCQLLSRVLSLPTLLDIAAHYGGCTPQSVSKILQSAAIMEPRMNEEIYLAGATIGNNLYRMFDQEMGPLAAGHNRQRLQDLLAHIADTCLTLAAFVLGYPKAAQILLESSAVLLEALALVHDDFIPKAAAHGVTATQAHSLACQRLVYILITHGIMANASYEGTGSSSVGTSLSVSKGELLLQSLLLLTSSAPPQHDASVDTETLVQSLVMRHKLKIAIENAIQQGTIVLDEAQLEYMTALLGQGLNVSGTSKQQFPVATSLPGAMMDPVQASLVSQVRDLLPDYGEGYVAACLEALGNSTEMVISALLEGDTPALPVSNLDVNATWEEYKAKQAARQAMKGKARLEEEQNEPIIVQKQPSQARTALYLDTQDAELRQKIQSAADAAQFDEYEDEYDDSFDDLIQYSTSADISEVVADDDSTHVMREAGLSLSSNKKKISKYWVLDGKIYNFAKPGSQEVNGYDGAQLAVEAAEKAAQEIHGLGAGGNRAALSTSSDKNVGHTENKAGHTGNRNMQQQQHKKKTSNKAAIGNHQRKERSLAKAKKAGIY